MSVALILYAVAKRLAPDVRSEWLEAAGVELAQAPDAEAPGFALGLLLTAGRLRLAHPPFVLAATRWGLVGSAVLWVMVKVRLTIALQDLNAGLPLIWLISTAGLFGLGALVVALFGLRAAQALLVPAIAVAAAYALGVGLLPSEVPNPTWRQALAVEDLFALSVAWCFPHSRFATHAGWMPSHDLGPMDDRSGDLGVRAGALHLGFLAAGPSGWTERHLWFTGTGLAVLFGAVLNLVGRNMPGGSLSGAAVVAANLSAAAFFLAAWPVLQGPQTVIGAVLFGVLALLALLRPARH